MKRRQFIATSLLSGAILSLNAKDEIFKIEPKSWLVLEEVFFILFPKTSNMPSSKEFGVIAYLREVSSHDSFDSDDKELIFQGAIDFLNSFPTFLETTAENKKNFIDSAVESSYGEQWINRLLYYGMEAMLSDPIYGGNKNEIAWKSLNHETGKPQPKVKYARVTL